MDSMDTDNAGGGAAAAGAAAEQAPNVGSLLAMARQLVDQGKPSLALQAVVMAMSPQGEGAVFQTLDRARERYRNKMQVNAAAEQLASLFAECAIAEAQMPLGSASPTSDVNMPPVQLPDLDGPSILALSGREQIVLDFFADGSSFVCLQCGGLVSKVRRDEHLAYWCARINGA